MRRESLGKKKIRASERRGVATFGITSPARRGCRVVINHAAAAAAHSRLFSFSPRPVPEPGHRSESATCVRVQWVGVYVRACVLKTVIFYVT